MKLDAKTIKQLRDETGAGILEVKQALDENDGNYEKAKALLMKKGFEKADKKAERVTKDGLVHSYIHAGGKVGSLVFVACETDFVAKTEDFQKLCHEIAMQVATEEYENVEELLKSEYIRDPSKTISDLIKETVAKVGENIEIKNFTRMSVK